MKSLSLVPETSASAIPPLLQIFSFCFQTRVLFYHIYEKVSINNMREKFRKMHLSIQTEVECCIYYTAKSNFIKHLFNVSKRMSFYTHFLDFVVKNIYYLKDVCFFVRW